MKRYLDYKTTIWHRIPIENKETQQEIIKMIEAGSLPTEIYDTFDVGEQIGFCEVLYETEEFIRPEENDNQSTIEIQENGKTVWDNSFESEVNRKMLCK